MSKVVLFCFPYAGGSEAVFYNWKKHLSPNIDLQPIHYAGRGKRFNEKCYSNFNEAVKDICEQIIPVIKERDYAFFGHSMGGLIAYEVCVCLLEKGYKPPVHLFMSGIKPPNKIRTKKIHQLPDQEFKEELYKFNGTPLEVINNEQLMEIFIPILRADFKLIEEYVCNSEIKKLNSGITVMYGCDENMSDQEMSKWSDYTHHDTEILKYPGDHFFISEHYKEIVNKMNKTLLRRGVYYGYYE